MSNEELEKLEALINRFEGLLGINEECMRNDNLLMRLTMCISRVQESKSLIEQAFNVLGK